MDASKISILLYHSEPEGAVEWMEMLALAGYRNITMVHTYRGAREQLKYADYDIAICTVPYNYGLVLSLINWELSYSRIRPIAKFLCICPRDSRAEKVFRYCSHVYSIGLLLSPCGKYDLCDHLEGILHEKSRKTTAQMAEKPTALVIPRELDERTDSERIESRLSEIGLSSHVCGYAYLKMAAELLCQDRRKYWDVTKNLYPEIADAFGVTAECVERAMRLAIGRAWENGCYEEQAYYFAGVVDPRTGHPKASSFIATVAASIRAEGV